jgi:hypothetical protein
MTSNHRISLQTTWRFASLVLVGVLLSACAKGPLCTELGTCGGDPSGSWQSATATCSDGPYFTPTTIAQPGAPLDLTLYGRPSPVAGQPPSPPTLSEWCNDLTLQKDISKLLISVPGFAFQDPLILNFNITFKPDLSYIAGFARAGRFGQYYSENCLTQFGQNPNDCAGVQATILAADPTGQFLKNPVCAAVAGGGCDCAYDAAGAQAHVSGENLTCAVTGLIINTDMQVKAQANSDMSQRYTNIVCGSSPGRAGCDCGFDVNYRTDQTGVYKLQGNTLITYPQGSMVDYSAQATFCRQGDTLDLSGAGDSYLLNQPSLRTIRLQRNPAPAP